MKDKPGRVACYDWQQKRGDHGIAAVLNAGYSPTGRKLRIGPKPWTAIGPGFYETFHTHAEAITYATEHTVKEPS